MQEDALVTGGTDVIRTSAPGKLFLLGEYAVLDGAPALLTAVDRRVLVTIAPSQGAGWLVRTPGLNDTGFELGAFGELPESLDARQRDELRVIDAVRRVVLERAGSLPAALEVTIDSTAFHDSTAFRDGRAPLASTGVPDAATPGTHKLGLGSSAAVATALTAALMLAAGLSADRASVFELALRAHRAAQGGTGSGGDVAASVFGGLIEYTRDEVPNQVPWPPLLSLSAVVTGTGSSTTDLVAKVAAYGLDDPAQYRTDIGRLAVLARQAKDTLAVPHGFLRLVSDYFGALIELDHNAHAGIVTEFHLRLHSLVSGLGGVFKTSGAGGGDVGLVFSIGDESKEAIASGLTEAGAEVVTVGVCAAGLEAHGAKDGTTR